MKYKIVFIDIDGTLRNKAKQVTAVTADSIRRAVESGLIVVICSARYRKYTMLVSLEANASGYIISSNGSDVYNYKTEETIYNKSIDKETLKRLYDLALKYDAVIDLDNEGDRYANIIRHPDRELLIDDFDKVISEHNVTQCVINDPDDEKIRKVIDEVKQIDTVEIKNITKYLVDPTVERPPNFFCDIGVPNVNKGTGIKELLDYLKISKDEAIAIGDGLNDLNMFSEVGYKVAMANSIQAVLDVADEVTLSNEDNGVAAFLDGLINE